MFNIPIRSMTETGTPSASSYIVFDDGRMRKGLVSALADAVRPVATLSEAQAGTDNTKTMTPLRVKDSVAVEIAASYSATATLTNKTFDTLGAGNVFRIAGSTINSITGAGSAVLATSPTLVTPNLGTPSAANLVNATGYPVGSVTGFASGVLSFLVAPNSANLAGAVSDETGSGGLVFANAPTLVNPIVGTQAPGNNTTLAASTGFVTAAVTASTAGVSSLNGQTGALTNVPPPQVRVTLVSGVAAPVADVTGATSIYATPVGGNQVPIWDGSQFVPRAFTERTLALCSNTGFTQFQNTGNMYDLYMAYSGGSVIFGSGPSWVAGTGGGATTRGGGAANTSEVQWINGIPTNKNAISIRTGPLSGDLVAIPANQGTIIGCFWPSAAGQASDTLSRRFLANVFNLVERKFNEVPDPAYTSSTYNSTAWRYANNLGTNAQIIQAFPGELVKMQLKSGSTTTGTAVAVVRIGIAVNGVNPPALGNQTAFLSGVGYQNFAYARYEDYPGQGYMYFSPFEAAAGIDVQNFAYESIARMLGRAML